MKNTEIINYLSEIKETQSKAIETANDSSEKLAVLMALHVKKLEILEAFEVTEDKQESFNKVKEALLDSVTEMIQSL